MSARVPVALQARCPYRLLFLLILTYQPLDAVQTDNNLKYVRTVVYNCGDLLQTLT